MLEKLQEKVATISDEMRSKVPNSALEVGCGTCDTVWNIIMGTVLYLWLPKLS